MPGMLAGPVRERRKFYNRPFITGWSDYNASNDAADQIIEDPSPFLLNQDQVFEAQGGWGTFGMTMGFALAGASAFLLLRPGMAAHLGRGQLKGQDFGMLAFGIFAGGFIGENLGISTLGDSQKYYNHWNAYRFVKEQNRFTGGTVLRNIPKFY